MIGWWVTHRRPKTGQGSCGRRGDTVPMGWGDHLRYQHEDGRTNTVGSRHAEARRGRKEAA